MKIERKKDASGRFVPLDVEGLVDDGLVVFVDFFLSHTLCGWHANVSVSAGARSRLSSRSFRAFRRLLPCSHRNASCVGL